MLCFGEADAGVIIHENRFTYQQKGLEQIADLGALWEAKTGLPIPLGELQPTAVWHFPQEENRPGDKTKCCVCIGTS